jgi:DNA-binding transcriptional LysR family regulator
VVHQLEHRLGVKLIDRSKRPFVLTPEGETYYDGCRKLVQRYDALEDQVRTLHEEVSGRVRVVSIYSVGLHHMSRYLQRFLSQYPKANVRLEYQHPHQVYEAVEKDQADLGLVSYPRSSRTIEACGWREEPMVLVCAPEHRFATRGAITINEFDGERVIGFDNDLVIRREIDRVLQLHGAEVRVVMEFDNIETMKRAVEIDAGVALLPEPTVRREVAAGTLVAVPLTTDELVRPLGIIYRRGKELGSTARRFIELLQTETAGDDFAPLRASLSAGLTSFSATMGSSGSLATGSRATGPITPGLVAAGSQASAAEPALTKASSAQTLDGGSAESASPAAAVAPLTGFDPEPLHPAHAEAPNAHAEAPNGHQVAAVSDEPVSTARAGESADTKPLNIAPRPRRRRVAAKS